MNLHKQRASEIFGVPEEEVTASQRDFAKKLNYSSLYNAGSIRKYWELKYCDVFIPTLSKKAAKHE